MLRSRTCLLGSLVVASALAAGPARADYPDRGLYVGLFGGYNAALRDWDLGGDVIDQALLLPDSSAIVGLRFGYHLLPRLTVEVGGAWLPAESTQDESNNVFLLDLELLYHLMPGDLSPFVAAGGGAYTITGGDLGRDTDPQGHVGAGVRWMFRPSVVLRAEVRDVVSDGWDDWGSHNLELTAGLDFYGPRGRKAPPPPPDADVDGVPDAEDRCPQEAGAFDLAGCPDRDTDGIADGDDRCPDVAGTEATGGCPDQDGDGIVDAEDKCPADAGLPALGGCPDQDGDGVTDAEDKCPADAGLPALGGCPDQDGDGVIDSEDQCPAEAGVPALAGCPDRDRDAIPDKDDACPDQAGVPDLKGCLPEEVKKYTGTMEGIQFRFGSARIARRSFKLLDKAVEVLQQYPTLRLRIEGHTDNVGDAAKNQKLSEDRANAVKAYMVEKGIEEQRIETAGLGDTQPKADNKTAKGRAQNRRIEFIIIGQ